MTENTTDTEQPLPSFNFQKEAEQYNSLIAAWSEEERKCKTRRELRENKRSVHEERQKGSILEDETYIPDRTIDSNIKRSKINYSNYITQSKRALIVTDVESPQMSIESLELWFTRGMRYPHWKRPWFELIDSMHVHGGACMEVVYDPTRPLNVSLEYVPREFLIIPLHTKDLQACSRILRCYEISSIQLQQYTRDYGFDEKVANDLYERFHKKDEFIKIYRILMKVDGVVHNAWYSKDNTDNWLRAPRLHDIGLFNIDPKQLLSPVPSGQMDQNGQPVMVPLFLSQGWGQQREEFAQPAQLTSYPTFWFSLRITENLSLLEAQGRVSLDMHVQEAMTSLLTDTVNGTHRASRFYPSAEEQPGEDPQFKELGPLKHGFVMNRKISCFQPAYPSPILLAVMQALKVGNADQSGQMDFSTVARKDANKTARELTLATQQTQMVETADMDVFSSPVLLLLALCFNISCQQAIFMLCKRPSHPELLIGDYNLQSAGDVEVVKREEDKQNAKEFFNIVENISPATAEKILQFLIQRFFPDQSDEWIAALQQPDPKAIISELLNIIKAIPQDEIPPEQRGAISSVIATASSLVGLPNDSNAPGSPGAGQANPAPAGNAMQQATR